MGCHLNLIAIQIIYGSACKNKWYSLSKSWDYKPCPFCLDFDTRPMYSVITDHINSEK